MQMLDIACHFYFFIIPTSILNTSLLTNTKSKPTQVRNIDPINHTVLCLLMDSNIIWFALRTRCHFCYFCSFWSGNFVSGWHIQKTYNDTFPIARDAADIMIWVTPHVTPKIAKKSIIYNYKATLYILLKSFKSMTSMYISSKIFNMVFLYTTYCLFRMSWGQWVRSLKGLLAYFDKQLPILYFSKYFDNVNGQKNDRYKR